MTPNEFIEKLAPFAQREQERTGVLSSITIAQGCLESGYGKYAPDNNLFGIKAFKNEPSAVRATKEFVDGEWIVVKDAFRSYDDWSGSVADHSDFLVVNGRYRAAGFFDACEKLDYAEAAKALQRAGYATDPNYAKLLISIIETYGLNKYDEVIELNKDVADFIIQVLGKYWHDMEGNKDVQNYTHYCANELRKLAKIPLDTE